MDQYVTRKEFADAFAANGLELPADFGPGDPAEQDREPGAFEPSPDGPEHQTGLANATQWKNSKFKEIGGSGDHGSYIKLPPSPEFREPKTKREAQEKAGAGPSQTARDIDNRISEYWLNKGWTDKVMDPNELARRQQEAADDTEFGPWYRLVLTYQFYNAKVIGNTGG